MHIKESPREPLYQNGASSLFIFKIPPCSLARANLPDSKKITSKSHLLSAKWWRKCMNRCKFMSYSIWNFLISNLTPLNLRAWKTLHWGPKGLVRKTQKMVIKTTLVHYNKHTCMKLITYHILFITREDFSSLPNFPLSPNTFIFPISFDPCHAQAWKQVMCKCIKVKNNYGKNENKIIKAYTYIKGDQS